MGSSKRRCIIGGLNTGKRYLGTSNNVTRAKDRRENAPITEACTFHQVVNTKKLQDSVDFLSTTLMEAGITSKTDAMAYDMLIARMREFYQIQTLISKKNFKAFKESKDSDGELVITRKPIMFQYDKVEKSLLNMLLEFGCTPRTRSKIMRAGATDQDKKDEWDI